MNAYDIIISPILTEKSYEGIEGMKYTFKVDKRLKLKLKKLLKRFSEFKLLK